MPEIVRTRFEGAAPILRVGDMKASIRYYVDVLGFRRAGWGSLDFTYMSRDAAGIYLCRGAQGCEPTWVWIGVQDGARSTRNTVRLARSSGIRRETTRGLSRCASRIRTGMCCASDRRR